MARSRSRSRERKRHRSRSNDREERGKHADKDREHKRRKERSRSRDRKDRRNRDRSRSRDRERKRDYERDRSTKEHRTNGDTKEDGELQGNDSLSNGNGTVKKVSEPLSLEEILKKRKEEEEREAKPVFLTKKQREELALKRREEAANAEKKRVEDARKAHQEYLDNVRRDQREAERRREEQERRRREEERERQKELELIKQQYLGGDKVKKKVLKPSEKFRFNFDWDAGDDTSRDLNPLYNNPHEAILLFGRGLRAGMDRREQKKAAAEHERDLLRKLRDAHGIKETREDRRRDRDRERAADKYDGFDMKVEMHWSEKKREEMTERDWRIFREDFNIAYKGTNPALPYRNWEEANLPEPLVKAIKRHGYKKPSPIQMAAIPLGLQQRDVIGIAETGSGKTAAFVLPMLVYIMKQPPMAGNPEVEAEGPYAVVMAPTRELAQQIEEETKQLMHYTDYRVVSVVGGQSIEDQGFQLRKGCEIVVATPGRMLDCLERSYAVLNQCNYLVLDEADRMIDMGFEPQVLGVLEAMPSSNLKPENEEVEAKDRVYRTTYMFSATMPPAVERLARKYLRRPVVITIGSAGKATELVTQRVVVIKDNEKPHMLEQELELIDEKRAIVFVNTKKQCDFVSRHLENVGYRCTVLHGGKTQEQRETSLQGFREEKFNVLVATDVAGRGIDVPDVALVINYDMPNSIDQYTHRIGRTGRAGRKGTAITLLTLGDTDIFYDLKKFLEDNNAHVPPQLAHHEAAKMKPGGFDRPRREQTVYVK